MQEIFEKRSDKYEIVLQNPGKSQKTGADVSFSQEKKNRCLRHSHVVLKFPDRSIL